ncbi:MAG: Gfo/Idh/MocA family oxidoreductase [Planctomycetota bacterium]
MVDASQQDEGPDREPTRFGIMGTGRITRRLVADLQSTPGVQVTAIASRTADRAKWYADQYGIGHAIEGYDALMNRDDVDAVYNSLPPSLHLEWSCRTAQAGKHLLCEKPLVCTPAEFKTLDDEFRAAKRRWLDATGWLHHPRTQAFAGWIQDGRLGKLGHLSAAVSFYEPFQSGEHRLRADLGGGCLLDLGWYCAGFACFVMGKRPSRVFADTSDRDGVPIRMTAMLWFEGGVTATLSCGYDTATRKWLEVAGSDASLVCDDFTRPWPDKPARCWIHEASGQVQQHAFEGHQERSMIEKLVGDSDLATLHKQAEQTQVLVDALSRSAVSRSVIDVPVEDTTR